MGNRTWSSRKLTIKNNQEVNCIFIQRAYQSYYSGKVYITIKSGATLTVTGGIWLKDLQSEYSRVQLIIEEGGKLVTPTLTTKGKKVFQSIDAKGTVEYLSNTSVIKAKEHRILGGQQYGELILRGELGVHWKFTEGVTTVERDITVIGKDKPKDINTYEVLENDSLIIKGNWNDHREGRDVINKGKVVFMGEGEHVIDNLKYSLTDKNGTITFGHLVFRGNVLQRHRIQVLGDVWIGQGVKFRQETQRPLALKGDWFDEGGIHEFVGYNSQQGISFNGEGTQTIYGEPTFLRFLTYKPSFRQKPESKLVIAPNARLTVMRSMHLQTDRTWGALRGTHLENNGEIILNGTAERTAYLYPIYNAEHFKVSGNGTVCFQHYLDNKKPGWFYLGSTVKDMPLKTLSESFYTITNPYTSINSFDEKIYGNDPEDQTVPWWTPVNDADRIMKPGESFRIYIWQKPAKDKGLNEQGDLRIEDKSKPGGFFHYGNYEVPVTRGGNKENHGWNFISNPYPGAINFDRFLKLKGSDGLTNGSKINNSYYVYSQRLQGYFVYMSSEGDNLGNCENFPNNFSDPEYQNNPSYIAPGQGFFVKLNDDSPDATTLLFSENAKPIDQANWLNNISKEENYHPVQFRRSQPEEKAKAKSDFSEHLSIALENAETGIADYSVIRFADCSSCLFESKKDYIKLPGYKHNVFSYAKMENGETPKMVINTLPYPKQDSIIRLGVNIPAKSGQFKLHFNTKRKLRDYRAIQLHDKQLGKQQDILVSSTYEFSVNEENYNEDRFELRLMNKQHLDDWPLNTLAEIKSLDENHVEIAYTADFIHSADSARVIYAFDTAIIDNILVTSNVLKSIQGKVNKNFVTISWKNSDKQAASSGQPLFSIRMKARSGYLGQNKLDFQEGSYCRGGLKGEIVAPDASFSIYPSIRLNASVKDFRKRPVKNILWKYRTENTQYSVQDDSLSVVLPAYSNLELIPEKDGNGQLSVFDWLLAEAVRTSSGAEDSLKTAIADIDGNGKLEASDLDIIQSRFFSSDTIKNDWLMIPEDEAKQKNHTLFLEEDQKEIVFTAYPKGKLSIFSEEPTELDTGFVSLGEMSNGPKVWELPLLYSGKKEALGLQFSLEISSDAKLLSHQPRFGVSEKNTLKDGNLLLHYALHKNKLVPFVPGDTLAVLKFQANGKLNAKLQLMAKNGLKAEMTDSKLNRHTAGPVSRTINMLTDSEASSFQYFPNPFTSMLKMRGFSKNAKKAVLQCFDASGAKVFEAAQHFISGTPEIIWDLSVLPRGCYIFILKTEDQEHRGRLFK
ncbi:MAG: hypothetical protein MI784_08805 [Cytophagales bacterium]|nr:hypothetical protein [Cytophagales bacterium]